MKPYALFFLGAALLFGCREADDVLADCAPTNLAAYSDLTAFLRRNAAPQQIFPFNLGQAQSLQTSGGALIRFGANAFVRLDGTAATGQAELRVRELYTAPDMLLADLPGGDFGSFLGISNSLSGNGLLSGGEFKLQAWQGSTRLKMRPADTLRLTSPIPNAILSGVTTWSLPLPGQSWTNSRLAVIAAPPSAPSSTTPGQFFYQSRMPLDSLSWWNVAKLWNTNPTAPRTDVEFSFEGGAATTTATRAWLVPTGANAVFAPIVALTSTTSTAYLLTLPNVPVGSQLTAVVLQSRPDGLYFGTQTAATQAGQAPRLTLTKLPEAEILRRIRQLQ